MEVEVVKQKNKTFKILLIVVAIVVAISGITFAWLNFESLSEGGKRNISELSMFVVVEESETSVETVLPAEPVLSMAYVTRENPSGTSKTSPSLYCRFRISFDLVKLYQTLPYNDLICPNTVNETACSAPSCPYDHSYPYVSGLICPNIITKTCSVEGCKYSHLCQDHKACVDHASHNLGDADCDYCSDPRCDFVHLCYTPGCNGKECDFIHVCREEGHWTNNECAEHKYHFCPNNDTCTDPYCGAIHVCHLKVDATCNNCCHCGRVHVFDKPIYTCTYCGVTLTETQLAGTKCAMCGRTAVVSGDKVVANDTLFYVPEAFLEWFESLNMSIMSFYSGNGYISVEGEGVITDSTFYNTTDPNYSTKYGWTRYADEAKGISYYYLVGLNASDELTNNLVKVKSLRKYVISEAISFPIKPDFVFSPSENFDVTFNLKIICQTIQTDYLVDSAGNAIGDTDNLIKVAGLMNAMSFDGASNPASPTAQSIASFTFRLG